MKNNLAKYLLEKQPGKLAMANRKVHARRLISVGFFAFIIVSLMTVTMRGQAQSPCDTGIITVAGTPCKTNQPTKVVFLIDRSGSMSPRGQTYNAQIEGIMKTLRDPTIISRDGSVEVGIVVFAGGANVLLVQDKALTRIDSLTAAENVAQAVGNLKCADLSSGIAPCPAGETSMTSAIFTADVLVSQNGATNANRLFILSTDGQTSTGDIAEAVGRVAAAQKAATTLGVGFELDVILMGLDPATPEFAINKANVDALVYPPPVDALPGATLVLANGDCNVSATGTANPDCQRQISDFASDVRDILRSGIISTNYVVNTEVDTAPGATPGTTLSLRQAIEAANCNGGDANITFAESLRGTTIRPLIPLPALVRPNININGCDGENCAPIVTIDGVNTDSDAGEAHRDGILIRSYNNTVRGLRIINFDRAGIAIDPICPADVTVNNTVAQNVLEANDEVGVLVLDPEVARAIAHSTGNTISRNNISDSPVLIDLGGDGLTPNDEGDADTGPNLLVNFPDSINVVTGENNLVNITGQVNGAAAVGSVVELFAVTNFTVVSNVIVIGGVNHIGTAETDGTGAFSATGLATSPVGIYTATVTDIEGNTSELLIDAANTKPGRSIAAAATPIAFGEVTVGTTSPAKPVQITNNGNAPLVITGCTVVKCATADPDNTARFAVTNCPTAAINPGQSVNVNVTVTPNACGAIKACVQFTTNDPLRPQITSELTATGNAVGQGRVTIEGGGTTVDFGTVGAKGNGLKLKKQPRRQFTIQNTGCQPLTLTLAGFVRTGANTTNGKITGTNDSAFFSIVRLAAGGNETAVTSPITLGFNETATFRVRFRPAIPAVVNGTTGLAASSVLPDTVTSQVVFQQAGSSPLMVPLIGRVTTGVKFINPSNPANDPVVNFTRNGDEFTVEFSLFDANLNTTRATFDFVDRSGRAVQTVDVDLASQIQARGLVTGQSFTVTQKFTGAKDNPNVSLVRINVTDGESNASGSADLVVLSSLKVESLKVEGGAKLVMPVVRLENKKSLSLRGGLRPRTLAEGTLLLTFARAAYQESPEFFTDGCNTCFDAKGRLAGNYLEENRLLINVNRLTKEKR
ncbi:MAG: choice-of-anchor D domain-containing protein [Acidobacteriota bacterium]